MNDMMRKLNSLAIDIQASVYNSYRATLIGANIYVVNSLYERFKDVRPGDLVVETTTFHMPGRAAIDAVGYLRRVVWEPIAEWDDEPRPTEKVFYIRTLDGREYRWTNADFISAPTEFPLRSMVSK
jgi:hypothetical protein